MNTPLEIQPELACDACGQAGAYALGDRALCVECYAEVSSSCAGGRSRRCCQAYRHELIRNHECE